MPSSLTYRPRFTSTNIGGYRYFFNGQEGDNEVFGEVANYTAEFWQYDSRLGRRWNLDPVFREYESAYACFVGNPICHIDPNGKDGRVTYTETETGGDIVIESTFFVHGNGADIAAKNANEQFAKLNSSSVVTIDGKEYNVRLNLLWVARPDLEGINVDEMEYADLQSIEGYKEGDNFLRVGVPEGGGKVGYLGESRRGWNNGYSLVTSADAVLHESLHNLGLIDTYGRNGFESDVMSKGQFAGQEINQIHYRALTTLIVKKYNEIKKYVIENQTQGKNWPVYKMGQDNTNPNMYHILLKSFNLKY